MTYAFQIGPHNMAETTAIDLLCSPYIPTPKLFVFAGLCKSTSEARRLIRQGGLYIARANTSPPEWHQVTSERGGIVLYNGGTVYVEIRE